MVFQPLIAALTLTGSLLSFIATSGVIISFIIYRAEQRSFRHALILNLTLAEFVNSLNNSISGIVYVRYHELQRSAVCTFNGFVNQISVQAADFSIFAIAIITLMTITRTVFMPKAPRSRKIMICLSVWIVPLVTAVVATSLGEMGPVSGNWCWIDSDRPDLRYALTHGWRFAIIFSTIAIYIYVWWYLSRHFRFMAHTPARTSLHAYSLSSSHKSSSSKEGPTLGKGKDRSLSLSKRGFEVLDEEDGRVKDEHEEAEELKEHQGPDYLAPPQAVARPGGNSVIPSPCLSPPRFPSSPSVQELKAPSFPSPNSPGVKSPGIRKSVIAFRHPDDPRKSDESFRVPSSPRDLQPPSSALQSPRVPPPNVFGPAMHKEESGSEQTQQQQQPLRQSLQSRLMSGFWTLRKSRQSNPGMTNATGISEFPMRSQSRQFEREISRMMLLNAYPIMYVILWIPGLVNRLMEAVGGPKGNVALEALQASSQYVGLANALTYGFNRHLRHRIKGDLFGRFKIYLGRSK